MSTATLAPYTTGSVTSADGTTIGYRLMGHGPALILVHGGMCASQNFMQLASALADDCTVIVPDRRGRGLSGPHGAYSLQKEVDDMQAVIEAFDAHNMFGLSSGALITLNTALRLPTLQKVALYEPPLPVRSQPSPIVWAERYDREVAEGKLAAAMVSIIKETGDPGLFTVLPRFLLVPMLNMAVKDDVNEERGKDDVPIRALIPTMHYDAQMVSETEGTLESYRKVVGEVLLLGGSNSKGFLKGALDALEKVLPHVQRVEFPGLGHTASNNDEQPETVARELQRFFSA